MSIEKGFEMNGKICYTLSDLIRAAKTKEELGLNEIKMSPRMEILQANKEQYEDNQRAAYELYIRRWTG